MNKERLKNGLEKMGIAADETALDRFEAFHAILDEYNARMDLTAVLDEDERVDRHDLDSAAPLAHGLLMPGAKVIDVGTGAGFPGVPLAIFLPEAKVTLLDSSEKKTDFIRETCTALGIPVQVVCGRSEELARGEDFFQVFDIAVARAVARLNILLELCAPYVRMGVRFLAYKGASAEEEVAEAASAAKRLGMELEAVVAAGPASTAHKIVVYRRVGETPPAFPRKYAKIKNTPL